MYNTLTKKMDELKQIDDICDKNQSDLKCMQNDQSSILNKLKDLEMLVNKFDKQIDVYILNLQKIKILKPFLKWLGGKTQIIHKILEKTPPIINNYHEMFVGGGSVLLGNLTLIKNKKIKLSGNVYAYDINQGLINVYQQIQNNKDELHKLIHTYINIYDNCPIIKKSEVNRKPLNIEDALKSKENYYYWLRKKINSMQKTTIEHAALFIVINKTTFRGMYRVGPNGFNAPYGNYKTTPSMMSKEQITEVYNLIKNVIFKCCDFEQAFKYIKTDDYVYLDPPYAPEKKSSFVNYSAGGFSVVKHNKLFNLIKLQNNINFCMSNANVKLVSDSFKKYNVIQVLCKRSINSKKPQSKTSELIITNYDNKFNKLLL
jgi:DNA adenine methylase